MRTHDRVAAAVSDIAVAALTAPDVTSLVMDAVLEALRLALGAEVGGFHEHQEDGSGLLLFCSPADAWARHLVGDRPPAPFSLTDGGDRYQLAVPVRGSVTARTWWAWTLARRRADFTASDRVTASALEPVLTVVARRHALLDRRPRLADADTGGLTAREITVLDLVSRGLDVAAVGTLLAISPRTAQKHIEHIYRKLRVTSRPAALQAAHLHGIL